MNPLTPTLALVPLALGATLTAQDGGVSTVGRAAAKRFANLGQLPPPQTIVVADLINYHRHELPMPRAGQAVALDLRRIIHCRRPSARACCRSDSRPRDYSIPHTSNR